MAEQTGNREGRSLTVPEAYALLTEGLENPESLGYVTHCRYVGRLAGMIAGELGLDPEYAEVLGTLHDIGRKLEPARHVYAGYVHLRERGYPDYADICLTHSYLMNDIDCTAGRTYPRDREEFPFLERFVREHQNTPYDEIIQVCDLLCTSAGGLTLEQRLQDIESRKGRHAKSQYHYEMAKAQKERIEAQLGHSIYDFYPQLNGTSA